MQAQPKHLYRFGEFSFDVRNRTLSSLREEKTVRLPPRAFDLLRVLIENREIVVSRDQLLIEAFPDVTYIDHNNIDRQIANLRRMLHDTPEAPRYIETVPRFGYKFIAEVDEVKESDEQTSVRAFIENLHREYLAFGATQSELSDKKLSGILDPDQIYVELECVTSDGKVRNALEWIQEGIEQNTGQLLLANFGMGKSFLTVRLMSYLLAQFERDAHGRIPLRFPLRDFTLDINQPRAILTALHKYASARGFGCQSNLEFEQLVKSGRFLFILDGIDEYPFLLNYIATDPAEGPIKVLEALNLSNFGALSWIATSRSGTFLQVSASGLMKYRVARLLEWRYEDQWPKYVRDCHEKLKCFAAIAANGPQTGNATDQHEQFLLSIDQRKNLKKLTNTPLFARMLVESWRRIVGTSGDSIDDDIDLYREYTDDILSERQVGGLHPNLDMRKRCLESLALYLLETSQSYCSIEDLKKVALRDNQDDGVFRITSFIEQLKTYSLLKSDSAGSLYFSHTSFFEYFLALALLRQVRRVGGWRNTELLTRCRFDVGKATFLARMLTKPEYLTLREDLAQTMLKDNHSLGTDFQRAVLEIALRSRISLEAAQLSRLDVTSLDFRNCDLRRAIMHGMIAPGCDFSDADLSGGAALIRADLDSCNLTRTNLRGAILRNATLTNIHIYGTDSNDDLPRLYGANLKGIHIGQEDANYLSDAIREDCLRMARESHPYDEQWCENALEDLKQANFI